MNCKLLFKLYNSNTKNLLFFAQSVSMIAIGEESLVTDQDLMESGWSYFDNRMLKMQVSYKWDEGTFIQRLHSKLFITFLHSDCIQQYGQDYDAISMTCIEEAVDCLVRILT